MIKRSSLRTLAMALDPVQLAHEAGYTLDPWQASLLRSEAPRILVNCSRQSGKSLSVALICLHTALYTKDALVLMVSPSLRQSGELFRTALGIYRALDKPVESGIENRLSLELENGSRIVSLPGSESTIRGMAGVKLIAADEASRIPDDLLVAIRPMLAASNGRLIAPSTPAGRRGWWYDAWTDGGDTWERYQIRGDECPRISKEFLAEERRALGPSWYSQEYECAFTSDVNAVFPEHYLARIITEEEHAWQIPDAPWEQQNLLPPSLPLQSWSSEIKIPQRDQRMTPYGIPYL